MCTSSVHTIMSQTMKNIKWLYCVTGHGLICEFIPPHDLFKLCWYFYALMHSFTFMVIPGSPVLIVNEICTVIVVNKVKSGLGFSEILWSYQRILRNCMLPIWPMTFTVTFRLKSWWIVSIYEAAYWLERISYNFWSGHNEIGPSPDVFSKW